MKRKLLSIFFKSKIFIEISFKIFFSVAAQLKKLVLNDKHVVALATFAYSFLNYTKVENYMHRKSSLIRGGLPVKLSSNFSSKDSYLINTKKSFRDK
jgi:hypothetical protein